MRTTLTLDPDVALLLKKRAARLHLSFKEVVNEAIRRGLAAGDRGLDRPRPELPPPFKSELNPEFVGANFNHVAGQLEDEELFYLLARGLPTDLAKNLLTYGFAEEVINKIGIDEIKSELDAMVMNRLGTEI